VRPTRLAASLALAALAAACGGGPETSSTSSSSSSHSSSSLSSGGPGGGAPLPPTYTLTGVVTDGVSPVEGASVMQGGGAVQMVTGADGKFTLAMTDGPGIPFAAAAKVGYRTGGLEIYELPTGPVEIVMRFAALPDNEGYTYGEPGIGDPAHDNNTGICGHCHTTYVREWRESPHSETAKEPLLQDLYAGASGHADAPSCQAAGGVWRTGLVPGTTDTAARCYLGAGVLPELNPACAGGALACDDPALDAAHRPTAFGRCADCHAPGINGKAGGRSLLEATGIAYDAGNHCDFCHHVKDVDLSKPPGVGGALILQRPSEKLTDLPGETQLLQVLFGADPDVPNGFMGGSWQPKFTSSELCGGCHEQRQEALVPGTQLDPVRWPSGLPTHSTYSEWAASSYGNTEKTCQFCHMPPDTNGLTNSVDTTTPEGAGMTGGVPRAPDKIRRHIFREPLEGSPRLIDGSVLLDVAAVAQGGSLAVTAHVQNVNVGHAVPSGEPMRSLLLVVRATACGVEMTPSGGMTLDDWGGALARGVLGQGPSLSGTQLAWAGAPLAKGQVVRVVRPTGSYDDYRGVGFFADPTLTPAEKGIEILAPVGEAVISAVTAGGATLASAIAAQPGDLVYVVDSFAWPPIDGAPALALAGRPGWSFARTLLDPAGARGVPHYRAVDILSDNRLMPGVTATTTHAFAIPAGCAKADVEALLLFRGIPLALARERGRDTEDAVVATATATAALP
jgi:hypothetical protein